MGGSWQEALLAFRESVQQSGNSSDWLQGEMIQVQF